MEDQTFQELTLPYLSCFTFLFSPPISHTWCYNNSKLFNLSKIYDQVLLFGIFANTVFICLPPFILIFCLTTKIWCKCFWNFPFVVQIALGALPLCSQNNLCVPELQFLSFQTLKDLFPPLSPTLNHFENMNQRVFVYLCLYTHYPACIKYSVNTCFQVCPPQSHGILHCHRVGHQ